MAKDKPAKYWRFKLDTRRKFTELSQEIARINSGGGADIDLTDYATKVWVEAKGYITVSALTPYALKEDIPSLVGYATEDFVNNKLLNYTTTEDLVENYASKSDLESAINGIDLSAYLLKADLTKSRIQSTLGISDWALAATKPSYTAEEVGALSLDGTSKMQQSKNIEWSNTEGYEDIDVFSNGLRLLGYNASKNNYGGGIHIGTRYGWQLMTKWGENPLYYRSYNINSQIWRDWKQLAFASDIPTKLSQLTDDVVAGKYLPLSGGTINGTAVQPLYLKNKQSNCGILFFNSTDSATLMYSGGSNWRVTDNGWSNAYYLLHSGNIGNYNAGSATKLQTPRTLWGKSFDGTDNVSGDINNAAGGIYIHNTNEINSFNGKLYLNHHGNGLSGYGSTNDIVMVANGGNVSIGKVYAGSTARLQIDTTATTNWAGVAEFLSDSLTDTHIQIGRSLSTKNSAFLAYHHTSANSNLNYAGIGFYGGGYLVKIYADGSIEIGGVKITASNGSITVNGNVLATGAITAKAVG